jgi:nitrogen regulatory protein PII
MKLITAIIKPEKLDELIEVIADHGAHGLTVTDVRGFGQQYGQLASSKAYGEGASVAGDRKAILLPKIRLDVVVRDDEADAMAEALARHARTPMIGDGKIWVATVDSVMRVRTGEWGRDAV